MLITVINGPNLNLLGKREEGLYGTSTLAQIMTDLKADYSMHKFTDLQSNIEGELVSYIQEAGETSDGVILNAGGYTHYSVAIADAVAAVGIPVIEVHITNISKREEFRHKSLLSPVCAGTIFGFGTGAYKLAAEALIRGIV